MDGQTLTRVIAGVVAVVLGALYYMRRKSRMSKEE